MGGIGTPHPWRRERGDLVSWMYWVLISPKRINWRALGKIKQECSAMRVPDNWWVQLELKWGSPIDFSTLKGMQCCRNVLQKSWEQSEQTTYKWLIAREAHDVLIQKRKLLKNGKVKRSISHESMKMCQDYNNRNSSKMSNADQGN